MAQVPDTPENSSMCLCASCPSKPADDLGFYCVKGKSPDQVERGFCACSWCPVWSGYGLDITFYCDVDAAGRAQGEALGE